MSTPPVDRNMTAPDWSLLDVTSDRFIDFVSAEAEGAFVVAFICNHCPYVIAQIEEFVATASKLQEQGIRVYAVMSNNYELYTADDPDHMKAFAEQHNFSFPYLVDEDQSVAHAYGAVCTPDVFGFNKDGYMQFRGNISELESTMLQIHETGEGPEQQKPSQGCSIKWK